MRMRMMIENRIAYCEFCDDEVEFEVKKEKKTFTVKGDTFEVEIGVAYCKTCGTRVFPFSLAKENDLVVYDEYRRRHNLLTSKEIKAIRRKRNLSQVELAKLIECGEKNIARYENGTIQDKVYDKLMRLIDDDYYYFHYCKEPDTYVPLFYKQSFVIVGSKTETEENKNDIKQDFEYSLGFGEEKWRINENGKRKSTRTFDA